MFINKTTPEIVAAMQKDFTMILRENTGVAFEHEKANVYLNKLGSKELISYQMSIRSRKTGEVIMNTMTDGNHCSSITDALDKARKIIKKMK